MDNPKNNIQLKRETSGQRPVCERVKDYREVNIIRPDNKSKEQASRCMDCGTPFCHWGCPVGSYIPEWNDLMFQGRWAEAFELLDAANNFPEITGRVCPAACEYACVLGINDDPVTIRENELAIIEYAFRRKLIRPRLPVKKTGRKVAVIGSGPAGLACAAQLNKAGHTVVVYEKDPKPGGILRYGIPDFKLEKRIIDRRIDLMKKEGVRFMTSVNVGIDKDAEEVLREYDAVCLAGGSRVPRDLKTEGRGLGGIHFAMDYLVQSNKIVAGEKVPADKIMSAKGKKVVVIGGGDTGSDCVGTAQRQGPSCVVQIEILPRPPACRTDEHPWPVYPLVLKTSSSHEEGCRREWAVLTKGFTGESGQVNALKCARVYFEKNTGGGCPVMKEVPDSDFEIRADLVILALGFRGPEHKGLLERLGIKTDEKGNVATDDKYATSARKCFSAGDMRRGQSLVVWAISEGRKAARAIDEYLMGESELAAI